MRLVASYTRTDTPGQWTLLPWSHPVAAATVFHADMPSQLDFISSHAFSWLWKIPPWLHPVAAATVLHVARWHCTLWADTPCQWTLLLWSQPVAAAVSSTRTCHRRWNLFPPMRPIASEEIPPTHKFLYCRVFFSPFCFLIFVVVYFSRIRLITSGFVLASSCHWRSPPGMCFVTIDFHIIIHIYCQLSVQLHQKCFVVSSTLIAHSHKTSLNYNSQS